MKRVLYLSNIEVPYRVRMFNEMAKHCDLTVLYERETSSNRNAAWANSEKKNYKVEYLKGIKIGGDNSFSLKIFKYIFSKKYDTVVFGCYNSPAQAFAILIKKLFRQAYIVNVDGETFLTGKSFKTKLKKFFLSGAEKYLVAGEKATVSIEQIAKGKKVIPYGFSSLTESELQAYASVSCERTDTFLVVGQYFDYKGMDVALQAARKNRNISYKFIGMGGRTEQFVKEQHFEANQNVELIPFLQKEELEKEYQTCAALILPSRQECWGLVVNEAASFGTPIVSTEGSGAAVEFLSDAYPQYLAKAGDAEDLYACVERLQKDKEKEKYSKYLIEKSKEYSIERMVQAHLEACEITAENG